MLLLQFFASAMNSLSRTNAMCNSWGIDKELGNLLDNVYQGSVICMEGKI